MEPTPNSARVRQAALRMLRYLTLALALAVVRGGTEALITWLFQR
ncbi:hypothetical protein [Streptomyces mirabilis]